MNETSAINPAALENLCRLGGQPFAVKMIDLYFSYGTQKMTAIRQAWQAGNFKALAEAAHPLKSSAGNVGAARVQTLAEQIERTAQEPNPELAGPQLDELEGAFAESKSRLEIERTRLARPPA